MLRRSTQRCVQFLIFGLLLLFSMNSFAIRTNGKLWTTYILNGNYGDFYYYVEPEMRFIYRPKVYQQFLAHMAGGKPLDKYNILYFGQAFSENAQDALIGNHVEYRLFQQLISTKTFLNGNTLISRMRIEERKSLYFPQWAFRFRERIAYTHRISTHLNLLLADEVMINLNLPIWITTGRLDENRAFIGIEQILKPNMFLDISYMNQYLPFRGRIQDDQVIVVNFRVNLFT